MPDGSMILSVAKAMELLQLLNSAGGPVTLTALSERSGFPKSTVFGLLTTMREYGVVAQQNDGRYTLGLRLFEYGCRVSSSWNASAIARPYMEHLAAEVNASAMLSICANGHVVTLDQVEGHSNLRVVSSLGSPLPIYCTSQGKVFLAHMAPGEAAGLLARTVLTPFTPHTIADAGTLLAALPRIRAEGHAVEDGEYKIGLRSVSAPIYDSGGALQYTIGVIGMFRSVRSEEFRRAVETVVSTGRMISAALGYQERQTPQDRRKEGALL